MNLTAQYAFGKTPKIQAPQRMQQTQRFGEPFKASGVTNNSSSRATVTNLEHSRTRKQLEMTLPYLSNQQTQFLKQLLSMIQPKTRQNQGTPQRLRLDGSSALLEGYLAGKLRLKPDDAGEVFN